jgi:hypothetical protein
MRTRIDEAHDGQQVHAGLLWFEICPGPHDAARRFEAFVRRVVGKDLSLPSMPDARRATTQRATDSRAPTP